MVCFLACEILQECVSCCPCAHMCTSVSELQLDYLSMEVFGCKVKDRYYVDLWIWRKLRIKPCLKCKPGLTTEVNI